MYEIILRRGSAVPEMLRNIAVDHVCGNVTAVLNTPE
jgi:hypothetical protein